MKIKSIIVDDERLAQKIVERYANDVPEIEVVATCGDAIEAAEVLKSNDIDLMFLDINMPKISGLNFLRSLEDPPFTIITTAYREFALEGFELDVIDYLYKPFSFDRFKSSVQRVEKRLKMVEDVQIAIPSDDKGLDEKFIFVKADKVTYKVNLVDIQFIESVGDYVKIFTPSKVILTYQTLKHLQTILPENYFQRVHKSFIISIPQIDAIEGNQVSVGEYKVPVGRSYRQSFSEMIQNHSS